LTTTTSSIKGIGMTSSYKVQSRGACERHCHRWAPASGRPLVEIPDLADFLRIARGGVYGHLRALEKNPARNPAGLVARKGDCGYRDEWRLEQDRGDRQEPNLVFCLTVHEIPTLEAMDRS
jgi:hypothetical protein